MDAYSDDLRSEFLDLRDEVVGDLQADGLIFAESPVYLVTIGHTDADEAAGIPGAEVETDRTAITPRPAVDLREQWRRREGVSVLVGDAKLTITRAVTREVLTSATYIEVDGTRFTLVEGELRRDALDWVAIVKRA